MSLLLLPIEQSLTPAWAFIDLHFLAFRCLGKVTKYHSYTDLFFSDNVNCCIWHALSD